MCSIWSSICDKNSKIFRSVTPMAVSCFDTALSLDPTLYKPRKRERKNERKKQIKEKKQEYFNSVRKKKKREEKEGRLIARYYTYRHHDAMGMYSTGLGSGLAGRAQGELQYSGERA